jgi:hypothetical protein
MLWRQHADADGRAADRLGEVQDRADTVGTTVRPVQRSDR